MRQKTAQNIIKVVNVLRMHAGGLWIRELARRCDLHMETVRRIIEAHPMLFADYADFTQYKVNFKILKLKDMKITPQEVVNYLKNYKELSRLK